MLGLKHCFPKIKKKKYLYIYLPKFKKLFIIHQSTKNYFLDLVFLFLEGLGFPGEVGASLTVGGIV